MGHMQASDLNWKYSTVNDSLLRLLHAMKVVSAAQVAGIGM